jgi:hypothetical protein
VGGEGRTEREGEREGEGKGGREGGREGEGRGGEGRGGEERDVSVCVGEVGYSDNNAVGEGGKYREKVKQ